jgi:DNA-binding helix-hairpin-helix protein with protein kinase domain
MEYFNSSGKRLVLGKELGKGGAARVYCDSSNPNTAIKIFHDQVLQKEKNLTFRLKKLVQLTQFVDFSLKIGAQIRYLGSFPRELVIDSSKNVVGYQMERIQNGIELSEIVEGRNIQTAFQSIKIKKKDDKLYNQFINQFLYDTQNTIYNRFVLCRNIALAFSKMYPPKSSDGKTIGVRILNYDIKPQNILVYTIPVSGSFAIVPYILDVDNFTLETQSKVLSPVSPQITPHYRAPEGPLDEYYDFFSLAVILYQLIFDTHPFTVRGETRFRDGDTAEYYINNRCFAWGKNRKFLTPQTKNDWRHNNWQFISPQLQTLFIRALDSEIRTNRPTPSEWFKELQAFIMVNKGKLNTLFKSV